MSSARKTMLHATRTRRVERPFRLLDLPKELRLRIYEFTVVPGTVWQRCDSPTAQSDTRYKNREARHRVRDFASTQLFAVSKQIKEESLPIYFSQNLFICAPVPAIDSATQPNASRFIQYASEAKVNVRSLSITLDHRILRATKLRDAHDEVTRRWPMMQRSVRENLLKLEVLRAWKDKWAELAWRFDAFRDSSVLDEGMEALLVGPWVSMPKRIEFVGVVTQDDDERITRNWISIFEARTSTLTMEDTQSEFKALEW